MIAPSLGFSRPAMQASAVLLPQPDGPSRVRNSPSWIATSRPSTALTASNSLLSRCRVTLAIGALSASWFSALEGSGQHAAHEVALEGERDHDRRDHREHARREHRPVVVEAKLYQEARDDHRDGLSVRRAGQDQGEDELVPA